MYGDIHQKITFQPSEGDGPFYLSP